MCSRTPCTRPGIGSVVWHRTGMGSVGRSRSAAAIRPRARARGSQTAAASRGGLAACARLPQCCSVLPAILAPPCNPIPHPSQRASLARIPAAARDPHPRPCRGLVGLRREAEADPAGCRRRHRALDPLLLRKPQPARPRAARSPQPAARIEPAAAARSESAAAAGSPSRHPRARSPMPPTRCQQPATPTLRPAHSHPTATHRFARPSVGSKT